MKTQMPYENKGALQKFTTIQCKNFLISSSCLKASKAETQGVKKPYPTPTITLPAMLRPNQRAASAGKLNKIAILSGISNLIVLHLRICTKDNHKYLLYYAL